MHPKRLFYLEILLINPTIRENMGLPKVV